MPAIAALIWGAIGEIFKYLFNKVVVSGAKFSLFFAFWIVLYITIVSKTTEWINELLSKQDVFANELWLAGISLLPSNTAFCLSIVGLAYSLFWILIFKRQMSEKYKQSVDSK
ncbi:TPA: hypothetical protein U2J54_003962 [Providencia rettgeri]|nr:hypothetical protein [Providencia rettgeri]HEM8269035.1 hypothetical protein [Providencia rettgeri]